MISAALALALAAAPPVAVQVEGCADVNAAEVRRLVELELLTTPASVGDISADVACEGAALAFRVGPRWRTVDLTHAAPNTRSRLLALAIVEEVEAGWNERLYGGPAAVPVPVPVVSVPRAPVVLPEPQRNFRLTALATSRALLASPLWQWGGGVRFVHTPFRYLGWAADASVETGSFFTKLGGVEITSGSVGGEVFGQLPLSFVTLQLGLGGRGGYVALTGIPNMPLVVGKQLTGAWGGLYAALSASVDFKRWCFSARAETGGILAGMPAHVENISTGMDGGWLSVSLGAGYKL